MIEMKLFPTMQNPSKCVRQIQLVCLANDHIIIASEINLNPMANHQIIKNGFNALNIIPVISGPCFGFDKTNSFFPNIVLICIIANTKKCDCSQNGNYSPKFWK